MKKILMAMMLMPMMAMAETVLYDDGDEAICTEDANGITWMYRWRKSKANVNIIPHFSKDDHSTQYADYNVQIASGSVVVPSYLGGKTVTAVILGSCPNLTSLSLPDSVKYLSVEKCVNLRTLISVNYVLSGNIIYADGGKTIAGCLDNETSLVIPSGVTRVEESAFSNCEKLQTVTFPSTLEELGEDAFYGCKCLRAVYYCSKLPPIVVDAEYLYYGCPETLVSYISWNIDEATDKWCERDWTRWSPPSGGTGTGGGIGTGGGESQQPDPGISLGDWSVKHTFNGLAYNGEFLAGLVQVSTAKISNKGEVKVSGFVLLQDGKKQKIKATGTVVSGVLKASVEDKKLGHVELTVGGNGFSGSIGAMKVESASVGENTGILKATVKLSYFDAKTGKIKTRSLNLGGVADGGEAVVNVMDKKDKSVKSFEAVIR